MPSSKKPSLSLDSSLVQDHIPIQIIPRVYIGSIHAAFNNDILQEIGITHILNASRLPPTFPKSYTYLSIDLRDKESSNILSCIPAANIFIQAGVETGAVLVHCFGGRSRSAAFIAAYMISNNHMSYDDVIEEIRKFRPIISINKGFEIQLRAYVQAKCNIYLAQQLLLFKRMRILKSYRGRGESYKQDSSNKRSTNIFKTASTTTTSKNAGQKRIWSEGDESNHNNRNEYRGPFDRENSTGNSGNCGQFLSGDNDDDSSYHSRYSNNNTMGIKKNFSSRMLNRLSPINLGSNDLQQQQQQHHQPIKIIIDGSIEHMTAPLLLTSQSQTTHLPSFDSYSMNFHTLDSSRTRPLHMSSSPRFNASTDTNCGTNTTFLTNANNDAIMNSLFTQYNTMINTTNTTNTSGTGSGTSSGILNKETSFRTTPPPDSLTTIDNIPNQAAGGKSQPAKRPALPKSESSIMDDQFKMLTTSDKMTSNNTITTFNTLIDNAFNTFENTGGLHDMNETTCIYAPSIASSSSLFSTQITSRLDDVNLITTSPMETSRSMNQEIRPTEPPIVNTTQSYDTDICTPLPTITTTTSTNKTLSLHTTIEMNKSPYCRLSVPGNHVVRIIPPLRGLERNFCCSWCNQSLFCLSNVIRTDLTEKYKEYFICEEDNLNLHTSAAATIATNPRTSYQSPNNTYTINTSTDNIITTTKSKLSPVNASLICQDHFSSSSALSLDMTSAEDDLAPLINTIMTPTHAATTSFHNSTTSAVSSIYNTSNTSSIQQRKRPSIGSYEAPTTPRHSQLNTSSSSSTLPSIHASHTAYSGNQYSTYDSQNDSASYPSIFNSISTTNLKTKKHTSSSKKSFTFDAFEDDPLPADSHSTAMNTANAMINESDALHTEGSKNIHVSTTSSNSSNVSSHHSSTYSSGNNNMSSFPNTGNTPRAPLSMMSTFLSRPKNDSSLIATTATITDDCHSRTDSLTINTILPPIINKNSPLKPIEINDDLIIPLDTEIYTESMHCDDTVSSSTGTIGLNIFNDETSNVTITHIRVGDDSIESKDRQHDEDNSMHIEDTHEDSHSILNDNTTIASNDTNTYTVEDSLSMSKHTYTEESSTISDLDKLSHVDEDKSGGFKASTTTSTSTTNTHILPSSTSSFTTTTTTTTHSSSSAIPMSTSIPLSTSSSSSSSSSSFWNNVKFPLQKFLPSSYQRHSHTISTTHRPSLEPVLESHQESLQTTSESIKSTTLSPTAMNIGNTSSTSSSSSNKNNMKKLQINTDFNIQSKPEDLTTNNTTTTTTMSNNSDISGGNNNNSSSSSSNVIKNNMMIQSLSSSSSSSSQDDIKINNNNKSTILTQLHTSDSSPTEFNQNRTGSFGLLASLPWTSFTSTTPSSTHSTTNNNNTNNNTNNTSTSMNLSSSSVPSPVRKSGRNSRRESVSSTFSDDTPLQIPTPPSVLTSLTARSSSSRNRPLTPTTILSVSTNSPTNATSPKPHVVEKIRWLDRINLLIGKTKISSTTSTTANTNNDNSNNDESVDRSKSQDIDDSHSEKKSKDDPLIKSTTINSSSSNSSSKPDYTHIPIVKTFVHTSLHLPLQNLSSSQEDMLIDSPNTLKFPPSDSTDSHDTNPRGSNTSTKVLRSDYVESITCNTLTTMLSPRLSTTTAVMISSSNMTDSSPNMSEPSPDHGDMDPDRTTISTASTNASLQPHDSSHHSFHMEVNTLTNTNSTTDMRRCDSEENTTILDTTITTTNTTTTTTNSTTNSTNQMKAQNDVDKIDIDREKRNNVATDSIVTLDGAITSESKINQLVEDDDEALHSALGTEKFIYLEYMPWMGLHIFNAEYVKGTIQCPNCQHTIGVWSWLPNMKQSHYGKLTPPIIRIHKKTIHESAIIYDATPICTPRAMSSKDPDNSTS